VDDAFTKYIHGYMKSIPSRDLLGRSRIL